MTQLRAAGIDFVEHSYEHDPRADSYGLEAADALGVPAARVYKTLVIALDRGLGVAVLPVDRRLDLKAAAAALGSKRAALAEQAAAERSTGYVVGGISPFGQRSPLPTAVDESALAHPTMFVSGGRRGFDVEVAPDDLVRLLDARPAPIAR